MSRDIKSIQGIDSGSSLLNSFGEYYRNRNSYNPELLENIFETAKNRINAGGISKSKSIFEVDNAAIRVSQGTKKARILEQTTRPNVLNIFKNIHKLGKNGGYAALAAGAVCGLYMLYKNHNDKPHESI